MSELEGIATTWKAAFYQNNLQVLPTVLILCLVTAIASCCKLSGSAEIVAQELNEACLDHDGDSQGSQCEQRGSAANSGLRRDLHGDR